MVMGSNKAPTTQDNGSNFAIVLSQTVVASRFNVRFRNVNLTIVAQ